MHMVKDIPEYLSDKLRFLSFVSAVLVVLIHIPHHEFTRYSFDWWCVDVFLDIISRVAVPFFFFASALLLFRNYEIGSSWYERAIKKRVRSLLLPFFMSNLLAFCINALKNSLSIVLYDRPIPVFVRELLRCCYLATGLDFTTYPLIGSLWFIRNLFVLVAMSPLIYWLVGKYRKVGLGVLGVAFLFWASPLSNVIFFRIGFSLEGLFWFMVGAYYSKGIVQGETHRKNLSICLVSLVGMLLFGMVARIWLSADYMFIGKAFSVVCGMVFIFTIYDFASKYVKPFLKNPVLSTSFFIYLFQFLPLMGISLLVQYFQCASTGFGVLFVLMNWLATVCLMISSALLFKNQWPKAYSFMLGGR